MGEDGWKMDTSRNSRCDPCQSAKWSEGPFSEHFVLHCFLCCIQWSKLISSVQQEQILQEGATPSVTPAPILLGWAHDGCGRKTYLTAPLCQLSYY